MDLHDVLYAVFSAELDRIAYGIVSLCPEGEGRRQALVSLHDALVSIETSLEELEVLNDTRITRVDPDLPE